MTKGCLWQPITELHSSTRSGNLLLLSCCPASAECWAFLALVWPVVHNVSKATICCIAPFAASLWSAIPIPCETQPSCPIQALSYSTKVFSCILSLTGTMRRKPVSVDGKSLEFPPPQCKALEYWPLEGGKMKSWNDLIELFGGRRYHRAYTQLGSYTLIPVHVFHSLRDFPGTLPLPAVHLLILQLFSLRSLGACSLYTLFAPFA